LANPFKSTNTYLHLYSNNYTSKNIGEVSKS